MLLLYFIVYIINAIIIAIRSGDSLDIKTIENIANFCPLCRIITQDCLTFIIYYDHAIVFV